MKMIEVMKNTSLPRSGILRRVREGTFPAYKFKDENGHLVWSRKDILNWKKENEKARA